ncbi:hypothetical protein TKK_0009357 [Trichogramma kaykai]
MKLRHHPAWKKKRIERNSHVVISPYSTKISSLNEIAELPLGHNRTKKKVDDVTAPKTIHDVPEKALNCGLTLPGYTDIDGRPVVAFDGGSTRREVVSSRDMASFFLYLARLPSANPEEDEFAMLVKANSKDEVETLDRALNLLKDKVKIAHAYLLRNAPEGKASDFFPRSSLKIISVENDTLDKHIPRRTRDYNHEHFIAYYKDYDTVMTEWQAAGRRLALEMLELKECTSLSGSLTPLNRLLTDPTFRRTATDAEEAVLALEERAAPLTNIMYIRNSLERARNLLEEVANAATRLESSFESRRATIRNLAVLRSIEDQAREKDSTQQINECRIRRTVASAQDLGIGREK